MEYGIFQSLRLFPFRLVSHIVLRSLFSVAFPVDGIESTSCVVRPPVSEEQCETLSKKLFSLVNRHDVEVP